MYVPSSGLALNYNPLDIPNLPFFAGASAFTIASWWQVTAFGPASGSAIFSLLPPGQDYYDAIFFIMHPYGFLAQVNESSNDQNIFMGPAQCYPSLTIPPTEWMHVVWVFDGTQPAANRMTVYWDGVLCPAVTGWGSYPYQGSTSPSCTGAPEVIGEYGYLGPPGWDGQQSISDYWIFSRALTAAEVATAFNSGTYPTDSVLAHWPFNEGSGTVAADASGNGLDFNPLPGGVAWVAPTAPVNLPYFAPSATPAVSGRSLFTCPQIGA